MANQLHASLAARILRHVRMNDLPVGHHLTEASLQAAFSVSRAPLRAAMLKLTEEGVLEQVRNRGFYVSDVDPDNLDFVIEGGEESLYFRIADDLLTKSIPTTVSETVLMQRYDLSRDRLRKVLSRIAAEGWVERREGRGWSFVQLIDSIEAYRESYELRQMLEPAGLLSDSFSLNTETFRKLTAQQEMVRDGGWETLGQIELFEANADFHEGLASMTGNRFLLGIIERQNQLRRLVEYRQTLRRDQVRGQNEEHLHILDLLRAGSRTDAAAALSSHLGNAKRRKANLEIFLYAQRRDTTSD